MSIGKITDIIVTEIVKRIMDADCLNLSLLNDALKLHKKIDQISKRNEPHKVRLEMAISDKIKQLSFYLDSKLVKKACNLLFRSYKTSPIKDVRVVGGNEIAIISEEEIEIGDSFHNIDKLCNGSINTYDDPIQEEAYLVANSRLGGREEVCPSPDEVFPKLYSKVQKNTTDLLVSLGLIKSDEFINSLKNDENNSIEQIISTPHSKIGEMNVYFDATMMDFHMGREKFQMIVTIFPDEIHVYDVEVTKNKWVGKKTDTDELGLKNVTILKENPNFAHFKKQYVHNNISSNSNLETESKVDIFRSLPFNFENLLLAYGDLFRNFDYKEQLQNEFTVERLKFITAEKFAQLGFDYTVALRYKNVIFSTIEDYKKRIINAIENGETKFPRMPLIDKVKGKAKKTNLKQFI